MHGMFVSTNVFRQSKFLYYFISRFLTTFALQVINVAVSWQVYDLTRDALALGIIGLFQFLPSLALFLITGSVADRYSRSLIVGVCAALGATCAAALAVLSLPGYFNLWLIYSILILIGTLRAFLNPAVQSLAPALVPLDELARAIAWTSSATKIAQLAGPVAGGFLYAFSSYGTYLAAMSMFIVATILISTIKVPSKVSNTSAPNWQTLTAGFRFIIKEKVVLGAISLDMFAVLLGGAVALMPFFPATSLMWGQPCLVS